MNWLSYSHEILVIYITSLLNVVLIHLWIVLGSNPYAETLLVTSSFGISGQKIAIFVKVPIKSREEGHPQLPNIRRGMG